MNIRKSALGSVMIKGQSVMLQAKQVQYGCVQVVNRGYIFDGLVPEIIGRPVTKAAFHPCPGQPNSETVWIVIASARVFLKSRHSAEFGYERD